MALVAGAPIKEVKYWPPWDQHVVAVYPSQSWLILGFLGGFLTTVVPFLDLFILFASRKSKWAYVLIFPVFQTVPTPQGDLAAIGFFIPFDISFAFGWILPAMAFICLSNNLSYDFLFCLLSLTEM